MDLAYYLYMSEAEKVNNVSSDDEGRYVKAEFYNGFPACDECRFYSFPAGTTYKEIEATLEAEFEDFLAQYNDNRFVPYDDYEDPEEAYDEYAQNSYYGWDEISKERYNDYLQQC